ncbi:MAG: divalent-cation tolerance protein CutA [Candidatus Anstonellales archaeon]
MYIIFTTTKKPKEIARKLIANKYAACVSYYKLNSVYYWDGKLVEDTEYNLVIKTKRVRRTISYLKQIHDYKLPEILYFRVNASKEYRKWVDENS